MSIPIMEISIIISEFVCQLLFFWACLATPDLNSKRHYKEIANELQKNKQKKTKKTFKIPDDSLSALNFIVLDNAIQIQCSLSIITWVSFANVFLLNLRTPGTKPFFFS